MTSVDELVGKRVQHLTLDYDGKKVVPRCRGMLEARF